MFDLDKAIGKWLKGFRKHRAFSHGNIREMELHLRDHIDDLTGSGMSKEEAFKEAVKDFGDINPLATEEFGVQQRSGVLNAIQSSMLRNFLLVTIRTLRRRRSYTFINILGLSTGLAAVILIGLYLNNELGYDSFHEESENVYRIAWMSDEPQTRTPHPMAQAMVTDFAGVKSAVSLSPIWGPGLTKRSFAVKTPQTDRWNEESGILSVDSTFFDVFSFELINGNKRKALREVGGILISESMAAKYFRDDDHIGKYLAIDNDTLLTQVEGVFKDVPANSHFHFDFLVSYVTMKAFSDPDSEYYKWQDFGHYNYVRLQEGASAEELEERMMPWVAEYLQLPPEVIERVTNQGYYFDLQPIEEIHLNSQLRWELEQNGNMNYVLIMTAAGILILIIAVFNFINLTLARSLERAGEVGVRKSLGAQNSNIYSRFLSESVILTLISMVIAAILAYKLLPYFNNVTGANLIMDLTDPALLLILFGTSLVIGLISGIYPAALLSTVHTTDILKGKTLKGDRGQVLRKILITFQFSISMFLIAGSMIVFYQLEFLESKDLGFSKNEIIVLPVQTEEIRQNFETLQNRMMQIDGVSSVSATSNIPGTAFNQNPGYLESDPDSRINFSLSFIDFEFLNTMEIDLLEGRNYRIDNKEADLYNSYILNETAVRSLNIDDPIGKHIMLEADGQVIDGTVIGVVGDFNFQSLHQPVKPFMFQLYPAYNYVLVKLDVTRLEDIIFDIGDIWKDVEPRYDMQYTFLDDRIEAQYSKEKNMGEVFGAFAAIAVIIACIGLVGIAAISFTQRQKEVGIRKVMGASNFQLITTLLKEYGLILGIAIIVGSPLVILVMKQWLSNFNYQINISPTTLVISAVVLVLIAVLSLSFLTMRTVARNPSDVLRAE